MTNEHEVGGAWRIDENGNRVLVHRTEEPASPHAADPAPAVAPDPKPKDKAAAAKRAGARE